MTAGAIQFTVGRTVKRPDIKAVSAPWPEFATKLSRFVVTGESVAEYMAMPRDRQHAVKDVGYYVGGTFRNGARKRADLLSRTMITLDLDHCRPDYLFEIELAYGDLEFILHSTHKHTPEAPRLRLIFPLARPLTPDEYEPIARLLAARLGLKYFDVTTFESARVMHFPSRPTDGEEVYVHNEGAFLDWQEMPHPDGFSMTDPRTWPIAEGEGEARRAVAKAQDPTSKPGVIGAFCRAFGMTEAIETFLADVYVPLPHAADRYTYFGSTSSGGAVVYDDLFLYSHHESDPAFGRTWNAWDLVRLHLYRHLDQGHEIASPTQLPSYQSMVLLAQTYSQVMDQLVGGDDEFADLDPEDVPASRVDSKRADVPERLTPALLIERLGKASTPADVMTVVAQAAATRMGDMDLEMIVDAAHDAFARSGQRMRKPAIRADIKARRRALSGRGAGPGHVERAEIQFVQLLMDEHWAGGRHLTRFGGGFWVFESGVWAPVEDDYVGRLVLETINRVNLEQPAQLADVVGWLAGQDTGTAVDAGMRLLRRIVAEASKDDPLRQADPSLPEVVNATNGEVWFTDDGPVLRAHAPEHRFTYQIGAHYDPSATCPEFDAALRLIFREHEDPEESIRHFLETWGYMIQTGRTHQAWFLWYGHGSNGKSFLLGILAALLGRAVASKSLADWARQGNSHAEAGLIGKLALVDDDFGQGAELPDSVMKKFSSAALITANPKNRDELNFIVRSVPLVLTNHWPRTKDSSEGMRRRVQAFHFNTYIGEGERDEGLQRRIITRELAGVLNRCITAYQALRERGHWLVPVESSRAKDLWVSQMNQVAAFTAAELVRDEDSVLPGSVAWAAYQRWCIREGVARPLQRSLFLSSLADGIGVTVELSPRERGDAGASRRVGQGWRGWRLAEEPPDM